LPALFCIAPSTALGGLALAAALGGLALAAALGGLAPSTALGGLALAAALGGLALAAALGGLPSEEAAAAAARSFNTVRPRISNASAHRLTFTVRADVGFRASARACSVRA